MIAPSCSGSVLVSFHHSSGKPWTLDPPHARSADNNVLLTPPFSRCFYRLNSFFLHKQLLATLGCKHVPHPRRASSS